MNESIKQKLKVHYYFNDDSHSMNAFVRNKAEKDFLEAVKRIGYTLDNDQLIIETEAYQEGGLIETLAITIPVLHYLSPSINNVITHHFTKNSKAAKLDITIKEETITNLQLDNVKKELELKDEIDKKLQDKLVARHVSNFYKRIDDYEKIQQIGYTNGDSDTNEYIVERKYFKNFILVDDTTFYEDDNAIIEIISPVLKEGKYSWRGKYKDEKIDFSMGDSKFKEEVIEGKHRFINGSLISCNLHITITYDEFGDEKRKNYSVKKVYGTQELNIGKLNLSEAGKKKQRKQWENEHYISLFDSLDKKTD